MNKTKNITNEVVTAYLNQYYQSISPALLALREEAEEADIPIILRETEDFLRVLLAIVKPARILEIGTAVGYSAAFFAGVCGAEVVSIEKDEQMAVSARENLQRLGYTPQQVRVLTGDGGEVCRALSAAEEAPFDLVFIDAAKSHYQRFLDAAMPLARSGTVIVSDNVLFRARVASDQYDETGKHKTNIRKLREYVDYIYHHPALETTVVACGDGLSVSRVKE